MSANSGPSGPIGIMIVGDHAQMMEAAKTNQYLAKLMPKTSVIVGKILRYQGSSESGDKAEMHEDWREALMIEGKKNDKQDGSGVMFDIVVIGGKGNGPSEEGIEMKLDTDTPVVNTEKMEQGLGEFPNMAITENHGEDLNVATTLSTATTAEKLLEAAKWDEIPTDPLTREQFGFSKVNSIEEESKLLGLYQGLFIHLPSPPNTETVQGWQENNKIAEGIYHWYKSRHGRSRYFEWFKSHQHFVDQTYIKPNSTMSHQ